MREDKIIAIGFRHRHPTRARVCSSAGAVPESGSRRHQQCALTRPAARTTHGPGLHRLGSLLRGQRADTLQALRLRQSLQGSDERGRYRRVDELATGARASRHCEATGHRGFFPRCDPIRRAFHSLHVVREACKSSWPHPVCCYEHHLLMCSFLKLMATFPSACVST